uniref:(northern house mosquito) hypothetical protein n=1 Tax=Culex pipiens TaxID=7175 RepID=A0A8D8BVP6_CULPI
MKTGPVCCPAVPRDDPRSTAAHGRSLRSRTTLPSSSRTTTWMTIRPASMHPSPMNRWTVLSRRRRLKHRFRRRSAVGNRLAGWCWKQTPGRRWKQNWHRRRRLRHQRRRKSTLR